ncbi:adenylylsulfate kinase [Rhodoferax sp. OV413]|nr:adenylylsulfate kinase [Rhodoferax sp. OV413]
MESVLCQRCLSESLAGKCHHNKSGELSLSAIAAKPKIQMPQPACTLWLTGLSASGKTSLAEALAETLSADGVLCRVLDGDVVRQQLSQDLGFSRKDRRENIRRVAELCKQLNDAGTLAIAALISPYRDDRNLARHTVGPTRYIEVYLATPLTVCEARDPKGLYRRARSGAIVSFTGISDPYEAPLSPELSFDTGVRTLDDCVRVTRNLLMARGVNLDGLERNILSDTDDRTSQGS